MRRFYFVAIFASILLALPFLLGGCGVASSEQAKSPFEQLQDRVTAIESKANGNAQNISTYSGQVTQLRDDIDAIASDIVDMTDGTDMQALGLSLDELEAYIGAIPEPEEDEELPTLVQILDGIQTTLDDIELRLAVLEAGSSVGTLECDPLNMTFIATAGASNPNAQYLTVDVGEAPTAWVATVGYPVDLPPKQWLYLTPAIGNQDALVSVSANITDLPVGVYYASITLLTASEVSEISVTLMVTA